MKNIYELFQKSSKRNGWGLVTQIDGFFVLSCGWYQNKVRTSVKRQDKLLRNYFGDPLKEAGAQIIPGENVCEPYLSYVNKPVGGLFCELLMQIEPTFTLDKLAFILDKQTSGCVDPPVNLANNQTLYGKQREDGIDLAMVCPHEDGSDVTIQLKGFYSPRQRVGFLEKLEKMVEGLIPVPTLEPVVTYS